MAENKVTAKRKPLRGRSMRSLAMTKAQMRQLVNDYIVLDPKMARVAQVAEITLLYAMGGRVDVTEEVKAFTDILKREESR